MLKQENVALRLLPYKPLEEKADAGRSRSKQALKVVKKEKKENNEGHPSKVLMPPQPSRYIKPPRHDFF